MEEKQKTLLKISMEIEDCFRKYFPQIVNKYRWIELSDTYTKIGIFADDLKGDIESAIGFTVQSISATLEEKGYSTEKMGKYITMKAYKEYINYIWEVDQLYVDMFNSLSSNSVAVFKAQERYKADLDRSYGIVTNSIATLALYELTQGVIDASKEAKNYGRALSDFRARQRVYIKQVNNLWSNKYRDTIEDKIDLYNKLIKDMLLDICCEIVCDEDSFEKMFDGVDIKKLMQIVAEEEIKNKKQEKEFWIKRMNGKLEETKRQIAELGWAFCGKKGKKKRELIKLQERIEVAIKTYGYYSAVGEKLQLKEKRTWDRKGHGVVVDFREKDFKYIVHVPSRRSILAELDADFLRNAGAYKSFKAFTNWWDPDTRTLEIQIVKEIKWNSFFDD